MSKKIAMQGTEQHPSTALIVFTGMSASLAGILDGDMIKKVVYMYIGMLRFRGLSV